MPRGRKKDPTIPTTRALIQNRDYRARKAQYVSDLEDKCRILEMQNDDLRREVHSLRVLLPTASARNPAVVESSTQLMKDLSTVSQTLARFQHAVFSETNSFPPPMPQLQAEPISHPTHRHSGMLSQATIPPMPSFSEFQCGFEDAPRPDRPPRFPRDILWGADESRRSHSESPGSPSHDDSSGTGSSDCCPTPPPRPR